LSAKWRRTKKDLNRFSIFKAFGKPKEKSSTHVFKFKTSWTKRRTRSEMYTLPKAYKGKRTKELEPLVDVLEENDEVIVVAEFAGFNRENIKANVKSQRLTLSAEALGRKYYKSLNLPKQVIPATMRTAYKNGVLEIRLKKAVEKKAVGNVAG
jgi:HSP20 family protein